VSISGITGSKETPFPVDVSLSNPDFRIGLTVNGAITAAGLVSSDGKYYLNVYHP
jgi:hypothetical protein